MKNLRKLAILAAATCTVAACTALAGCAAQTQTAAIGNGGEGTEAAAAAPDQFAAYTDDATCLACHGDSYETLAETTADYGDSNPHDSVHGGYLSCNNCHAKGNEVTHNQCLDCHGWPRPDQSVID